MTWSKIGQIASNAYSLSNIVQLKTGSTGQYSVGYANSTSDSWYHNRDGVVNAQIHFATTTSWPNNSGADDTTWRLWLPWATIPRPKNLQMPPPAGSSDYYPIGYAHHYVFGGRGSDFLIQCQYSYTYNNYWSATLHPTTDGITTTLNESNKTYFMCQFFGTYGEIDINLEYEV